MSGIQQSSFKTFIVYEKKIQDLVDKGFKQMMIMTEHYMETTKKQFKNFKKRNIDSKIRQAKRMYEDQKQQQQRFKKIPHLKNSTIEVQIK